jgi:nucleoid-associated protein YgaU
VCSSDLAGDLRYRKGLAEFYPGLETSFHQGLFKARVGRGFQLDGVRQIAFGFGVNLSPLVLDVAMTVPTNGIHRQGGSYQASLNYRFGAPSFIGNFIGQAAAQADALRAEVSRLEEQKKNMENDTHIADTNKTIVSDQMSVLQKRLAESQDELRLLEKKKDELEYEISLLSMEKRKFLPAPPPPPKPKPRPKPEPLVIWPRRHQVRPGQTLRSIAEEYYHDSSQWERIYDANRENIERGLPKEGAVLTIPDPRR